MKNILKSFAYHIANAIASLITEVSESEIRSEMREAWNNVYTTD